MIIPITHSAIGGPNLPANLDSLHEVAGEDKESQKQFLLANSTGEPKPKAKKVLRAYYRKRTVPQ